MLTIVFMILETILCSTSSFYNTYMISHTSSLITHIVVSIMTMYLKLLSSEISLKPGADYSPCWRRGSLLVWKNEGDCREIDDEIEKEELFLYYC